MAISSTRGGKTPDKGRGLYFCPSAYHDLKNTTSETLVFTLGKDVTQRGRLPDSSGKRSIIAGPPDRQIRFEKAAKEISRAIIRNRPQNEGGAGRPIVVEGIRDEQAVRALGFIGTVEKVNRGWDQSRLIAYLHSNYCKEKTTDGGPCIILLMDWDRTGGNLQTSIRNRLMALDVPVDEDLRNTLLRTMKPEGRTVESLLPHALFLEPLVQGFISEIE